MDNEGNNRDKEYDIKDDADFPLKATEVCKSKEEILRVNKMMERAEAEGDTAIRELLTKTGEELARTVFGCAERLQMVGDIEVILAGSVWTKGHFETMYRVFKLAAQTKVRRGEKLENILAEYAEKIDADQIEQMRQELTKEEE